MCLGVPSGHHVHTTSRSAMYHCLQASLLWSLIVGTLVQVPQVAGNFGLTSRELNLPLLMDLMTNDSLSRGVRGTRHARMTPCDLLKLQPQQKRMCKREVAMGHTLLDSLQLSVYECQYQFQFEKWNCSLGQPLLYQLKKGFRETAFLFAISSAGLVHSFARACSSHQLERCTCDNVHNKEAWLWGGCGDNIRFGMRFTRRFLRAHKKNNKDLKALVDRHNSRLGMRLVRDGVRNQCKCHGVSGSCTIQTCWRQLSPFHVVASAIKDKYEDALDVNISTNKATGEIKLIKRRQNSRNPTPSVRDMVYIEKSLDYCQRTAYTPGTSGRVCTKGAHCDSLCCGFGYNTQVETIVKRCHCQVIWCCEVKCHRCRSQREIYTCK